MSEKKEGGFTIDLSVNPKLTNKISSPAVALAIIFLALTLVPFNEINSQAFAVSDNKDRVELANIVVNNTYPAAANKEDIYNEAWKREIKKILTDTPMAVMTEAVIKRNRPVAAFLVGIAMKESKFGKYSPKKDGTECFNYWGYRGKENRTASGYSCFKDPEQAVKIVGDRIEAIVKQGAKTPSDMISWKCGRTCAGHSPESVAKWISDVAEYYYVLNPGPEIARKN